MFRCAHWCIYRYTLIENLNTIKKGGEYNERKRNKK